MTKARVSISSSTLALVLAFICALANGPERQEKCVLACTRVKLGRVAQRPLARVQARYPLAVFRSIREDRDE